jgi:hypothetical protein
MKRGRLCGDVERGLLSYSENTVYGIGHPFRGALSLGSPAECRGGDLLRVLQGRHRDFLHLSTDSGIEHHQRDLLVQGKRAVTKVQCADGGPGAIDDKYFRNGNRRLPFVNTDTGFEQQFPVGSTTGQPDDGDVGATACGQDPHIDASTRGGAERGRCVEQSYGRPSFVSLSEAVAAEPVSIATFARS